MSSHPRRYIKATINLYQRMNATSDKYYDLLEILFSCLNFGAWWLTRVCSWDYMSEHSWSRAEFILTNAPTEFSKLVGDSIQLQILLSPRSAGPQIVYYEHSSGHRYIFPAEKCKTWTVSDVNNRCDAVKVMFLDSFLFSVLDWDCFCTSHPVYLKSMYTFTMLHF